MSATQSTHTPEQAAATLHARYAGQPWYCRTVPGQADDGGDVLYLVVATGPDRYRGLPFVHEGYSVLVRADTHEAYRTAGRPAAPAAPATS